MEITFCGKRALVTGASQGIGRNIALGLAKCGAHVVAMDINEEGLKTLKEEIENLEIFCVDLTDWEATKLAAKASLPIDLLVNCAGMCCFEPIGEIEEESVDRIFGVNVKTIINLSQVVATSMRKRKVSGAIVNVSSIASLNAEPDILVYCASKAAVDMITKCMALDLGPYNIRTNSICPTGVDSGIFNHIYLDSAKRAHFIKRIPLGRLAAMSDVVGSVLYLLSDHAGMINGCCLPVDGGSTSC